jgi:hypothetical protein
MIGPALIAESVVEQPRTGGRARCLCAAVLALIMCGVLNCNDEPKCTCELAMDIGTLRCLQKRKYYSDGFTGCRWTAKAAWGTLAERFSFFFFFSFFLFLFFLFLFLYFFFLFIFYFLFLYSFIFFSNFFSFYIFLLVLFFTYIFCFIFSFFLFLLFIFILFLLFSYFTISLYFLFIFTFYFISFSIFIFYILSFKIFFPPVIFLLFEMRCKFVHVKTISCFAYKYLVRAIITTCSDPCPANTSVFVRDDTQNCSDYNRILF